MSTAKEIELRAAEARAWLDKATQAVANEITTPFMLRVYGREVCARRARKLRKRGAVVRFTRWTPNGKCRYHWMPPPFRFILSAGAQA